MDTKDLLIELSQATGVSGHEAPVRGIVQRELERYADEVHVTKLGSLVAVRRAAKRSGKDGSPVPRLLFEGHMDEIGLMVTAVESEFIRFDQVGGYDARILPAQNVLVHSRETLPGVIGMRPPHVVTAQERDKPVPLKDLFVDTGLPEARVRELVTVGDIITLDRPVVSLKHNSVAGKAFDDRAAVVTVIEAMRELQGVRLDWDVYAVANVQEEDGAWFSGAFTSTYKIHPDAAIALDVSHADQPGVSDVNVVPLDKGPGIAMGPNVHPLVHKRLVETARRLEIPHRVTVYPGPTGTDAWAIQVVAEGIPTGLLDLPLRDMHTPVEMLAIEDLARSARLLAGFATSVDDEFYQTLKGKVVEPARPAQARPTRKTAVRGKKKKR